MDNKLAQAIVYATVCHEDQLDKSGQLYILHPLRVMLKMDTEDEKIVAVLHDVLEDTNAIPQVLVDTFGPTIYEAVCAITRRELPTKEKYFDYIRRCKQNELAKKVKLADLEDNMSSERLSYLKPEEQGIVNRYIKAKAILLDNITGDSLFPLDHLEHTNS